MKVLFIDTETSGLPKNPKLSSKVLENWPRVLQVAWKINTDEDITNIYISPDFDTPFKGVEIHKITREYATEHGRPIVDVLHELNRVLESVDAVCAHNIEFDVMVLLAEFHRYGIETTLSTKVMYDTMRVNGRWLSLQKCYDTFVRNKIDITWHNAKDDILACEACFNELIHQNLLQIYDFVE